MELRRWVLGVYALNKKKKKKKERSVLKPANFQYALWAVVAELSALELCCCSEAASA